MEALPDDAASLGADSVGRIMAVLSGVLDAITNAAVLLFVGVYVGLEPRIYRNGALRVVPEPWRDRADAIFDRLGTTLAWWVVGRLASMAVVGILSAVALWVIGVPLAFALGVIAALFSFVPFLGPIASVVPAALVAIALGPQTVLYVLLAYLGVQIAESYVITPLIQKRATSIPPALLILAQVVFGLAAGIVGIIYATPLVVLMLVLCDELLPPLDDDIEEKHRDNEDEDEDTRSD